ncbi:MOSC domain-containing protein [Kitasatospora sp. NPDC088391]|uniref:MOSC domain-containing protein n=1 Tax=Kitasatospora sp. NPDC088391 TaxID=3364074 RepID=UPI00380AE350
MATFVKRPALEAALEHIRSSPADNGTLEMIVRRPDIGEREVLDEGLLTFAEGLAGDVWRSRGSRDKVVGDPDVNRQLTVMNSRCADLVSAQDRDRWQLAGDQLYVDLDLSIANVPPGTRLRIGSTVIEATRELHLGCSKFQTRFGWDAVLFVNSRVGRELRLRGMSARVVTEGTVRPGDKVQLLADGEC